MSSRIEQIIEEIEEYVESCKYQTLSTTKIVVNKEELEELYLKRRKYYLNAAHITVRTEGRSLRQIVDYAAFQINRLKGDHIGVEKAWSSPQTIFRK